MLRSAFSKFGRYFSNDIGIDLGTANTLVYLRGHGIVINEPSVVAVNKKTGQVVAVGRDAKEMLGRTPPHISAIKPVVGGVISDFEVAEEMLAYLIRNAEDKSRKVLSPRVVVGVPSGVTNVETRAVRDAARNRGARQVFIVEEAMAAAIGIRLDILSPVGNMVVDIGGGTTDIAVISMGGVVRSKSLKIAGERFSQDIISFIRSQHKMLIGERSAEALKMEIGSVMPFPELRESVVRGRDLVSGLPREFFIAETDVRQAILPSVENLIESVKEVLELTPPEIISDVMKRGVFLVGGGALLRGLPELLAMELALPVHLADDPMTAVARGAGVILDDFKKYQDVLIPNEDELPPK